MDIIMLGVYTQEDVNILNEFSEKAQLSVFWNLKDIKIESAIGINQLMQYYQLYKVGIIIEKHQEVFSSYSIIDEISEFFQETKWYKKEKESPKFFKFLDYLEKSKIKKIIIAFADEWDDNTTVTVENIDIFNLKNKLNTLYVWCNGYKNLISDCIYRDDSHPLVVELEMATPTLRNL